MDGDFNIPARDVLVQVIGTDLSARTDAQGRFRIDGVPAGPQDIAISKEGFYRKLIEGVVVEPGKQKRVEAEIFGVFTDLEPKVMQALDEEEEGLEALEQAEALEAPASQSVISSEFMRKGGFSDAAAALRAVSGASVADGKFAVIRGLPDRYVSSQLNGVRLPSADEDTRAVELDQFPSAVLQALRISKTFTPDQQGDASGGAVDVILRGIPSESIASFSMQLGYNSQVTNRSDFLSYNGGGVSQFGLDSSRVEQLDNTPGDWTGAVGVRRDDAPTDWKWNAAVGDSWVTDDGVKLGGFLSVFYERDSSFRQGIDDSYWVDQPGGGLVPELIQDQGSDDFKTSLFDVTEAAKSVQWGGIATFGVEFENHKYGLSYLHSHNAEDKTTLAEDTRGKEYYFGPNFGFTPYDVNDPMHPGNISDNIAAAPYLRTETLQYTERTTGSFQLTGEHTIEADGFEVFDLIFDRPVINWTVARSFANQKQPDKRQFGTTWLPESFNEGLPPILPPFITPATHVGFFPAATFSLGNLQRIFKTIEEDSQLFKLDATFPFDGWDRQEGFAKVGLFTDRVDRTFDQNTFSNSGDQSSFQGDFDQFWSEVFPFEPGHTIFASELDVDYTGNQDLDAVYAMVDLPLDEHWKVITGARLESTELGIINDPEALATYFPPGSLAPTALTPGAADVAISQDDLLPSLTFAYEPDEAWTFRAAYSETVARQTFKELTPILQQEFLGGPVFIGNPDLQISSLKNFDLRADYVPEEGTLFSVSAFHKDITDPIEYVQRIGLFSFTTPVNYPEGELTGFEFEARQDMYQWWDAMRGVNVGMNATFIDSEVQLPQDEIDILTASNVQIPLTSREMTNAPDRLLNLFVTYDVPATGTELGLFYTVQGRTLVAGAGINNNNFVPSVYTEEYDTLNFTLTQPLGDFWRLRFQARNLTNPTITNVYSDEFIGGGDVPNTTYSNGIDYSISLGIRVSF